METLFDSEKPHLLRESQGKRYPTPAKDALKLLPTPLLQLAADNVKLDATQTQEGKANHW